MAFKTMRLQLRFLLPLMLTLAAAAYVSQPLMDRVMLRWFSRDLNIRAMLVADTLSESMAQALRAGQAHRVKPLLDRVVKDERLLAVALCDAEGRHLQVTAQFPPELSCERAQTIGSSSDPNLALAGGRVHVGTFPHRPTGFAGAGADRQWHGGRAGRFERARAVVLHAAF